MPKFKIITLGCRVNQAESAAIADRLVEAHWEPAAPNEAADLCLINTCTVTRRAAMQSRQAIRRAILENSAARVAATGCYAATDPHALLKIKGLDGLIAQKDKLCLPDILPTAAHPLSPSSPKADRGNLKSPPIETAGSPKPAPALPPTAARTRPLLKIQDGCDAFCTYCIVPYARGPSRSLPLPAVLDAVSRLSARGFLEVVLTGIHLGNYGKDLSPRTSLTVLLQALLERPDPIQIRLSSIEPLELTDALIELAAQDERICRHFHVPLQSGDAQVLKRMGRPYSPEMFSDRIARIRERLPEAAIGADMLVGFPGETEAAFEATCALAEALPLTYLHVFPFSARPGTPACSFSDPVPAPRITERCARLRQLSGRKRLAFHRRFIGRSLPVVTESRRDPQTGLLKGVSSNYLPVLFAGGDELIHLRVEVYLSDADARRLTGALTSKPNTRRLSRLTNGR
jgi:threonylcarbamoyladenosine tRNA methylthiotransferase MtaB